MPKLEPQIEFSVGTSSHELAKHLDFAVRRSCVLIPRTPLGTFHQRAALFAPTIGPAQSLLTAREFHVLHLLACAGMTVNTHGVHLEQAELLLGASWVLQLRPRSGFGRLVHPRSKPLGGGRTLSDRARRVLYL